MLQRIFSKFGNDTIDESPQEHRTMGFGKAITMWLGANVVVTTILTGMLLVPRMDLRKNRGDGDARLGAGDF